MPELKLTLLTQPQTPDNLIALQRQAAKNATAVQPVWAALSPRQRRRMLWTVKRVMKSLAPGFAGLLAPKLGQNEDAAMAHQVLPAAMFLAAALGRSARHLASSWPVPASLANFNKITRLNRKPLGVVVVMADDPGSFALSMGRIITALLAGNTLLVLTDPEQDEFNNLMKSLLAAVSAPPGVINFCNGGGVDAAALVEKGLAQAWLGQGAQDGHIPAPKPNQTVILNPDADPLPAAAVLCGLATDAVQNLKVLVHWSLERALLRALLDHGPVGARILPCIRPVQNLDSEIAALAKQPWGKVASVWSRDHFLAREMAGRLFYETVYINDHQPPQVLPELPGGWVMGPRPNLVGLAGLFMQVTRGKATVEETGQGFLTSPWRESSPHKRRLAMRRKLAWVLDDGWGARLARLFGNR
jgi:hypothetical protein